MCKSRRIQMSVRQRRKMEQRREIGRQKSKEPAWKKLLNPRGGRYAVYALALIIFAVYMFNFHNPHLFKWRIDERSKIEMEKRVDVSQETQLEVMRNLTATMVHILHQFCDSFGECFNVENRYWDVGGKLIAQRMISIRARSNLVLTMAHLTTPQVLTAEYLDPMRWEIDKSVLISTYNAMQAAAGFMFGASFASLSLSDRSRPQRVLQIGMGGGATTNFLALMPVNLLIDVVELEPTVYDVAKKYFGLTENERVKVKIEDGVKFVERAVTENVIYESILLDACTNDVKEDVLCPVNVFRNPEVIENLSKIVGSTGVLSVNMFTTRDRDVQQYQIESLYQKFFVKCFALRFTMDQKMLFCSNRKDFDWQSGKVEMLAKLEDFDYRMRLNLKKVVSTLNN